MDYNETSQEVLTAIAMIKSMTTTARRRSGMSKSPFMPRLNKSSNSRSNSIKNSERGIPANSKTGVSVNNGSIVASSKSSSWPTRGVALASIEFKRGLQRRKIRYNREEMNVTTAKRASIPKGRTEFTENRESTRMKVLKSIFANAGETSFGTAGSIVPAKRSTTKRSHSKFTPATETGHFSLPLLSIEKITPLRRPTFQQGSKIHHMK